MWRLLSCNWTSTSSPRCCGLPITTTRAQILIRRRRVPVAQLWVPVRDGLVDMDSCRHSLREATAGRRWRWEVDDYVGGGRATSTALASNGRDLHTRTPRRSHEGPDGRVPPRPSSCGHSGGGQQSRDPAHAGSGRTIQRTLQYVRENRPGLDAARNRALREATTPVVAFTDDDAVPEPAWLGHLLRPFEDPRVLCTSGLTLASELETPAQEWFERLQPVRTRLLTARFSTACATIRSRSRASAPVSTWPCGAPSSTRGRLRRGAGCRNTDPQSGGDHRNVRADSRGRVPHRL